MEREKVMSEWISVNNKMPVNEDIVDIYTANNGRFTDAQYVSEMIGYWLTRDAIWINLDKVTHWMPLPEPPNE